MKDFKMILIPWFQVTGKLSYPDNPKHFLSMLKVEFNGEDYYLCQYTGKKAKQLQNGTHTYDDYKATMPPERYVLTVQLSANAAEIEQPVTYRIETEPKLDTKGQIIPVSITDRNGMHAGNLGVEFTNGIAQGTVAFNRSGDFYIKEEDINYHGDRINAYLELAGDEPLIRAYLPSNAIVE